MDIDHKDGVRASRRMHCASEQHECKRQDQSKDVGGQGIAQKLVAGDANEGAT